MLFTISLSSFASERFTIFDLEGTYAITGIDVPYYKATATLSNKYGIPTAEFIEEVEGEFLCRGFYSVSYGNQVDLNMYCGEYSFQEVYVKFMNEVEPDFSQTIYLENVTKADSKKSFIAPVKSSLFGDQKFNFKFTKQ
jgi:hypothetical protein